ncbi:hypothetical protein [Paenibacillus ginsengarvi]|uniref:DUF2802 domain-containing protein n=1 Tax=Paenibacillus ginsengarvi TaxID=400777 RepID=A0A3B0CSA9_9BACL|nr:hypothetical protein [Paenibacillus ginsengarvi]RKN86494.1 hypothetical protein D7M11_00545 [Paenibacillus ginsengarvi]
MADAWLYIVLLGGVIVVYAKFVPKRETDTKQTHVIKEIEQTMEQFSADLEEENRQLLQLVSDMKHDHQAHTAKLEGRLEAVELQNRAIGEQIAVLQRSEQIRKEEQEAFLRTQSAPTVKADHSGSALQSPAGAPIQDEPANQPDTSAGQGPMSIRQRYSGVFELYDQGKSTEYIAKKLEMNKGEVTLIIQLAEREAQARV